MKKIIISFLLTAVTSTVYAQADSVQTVRQSFVKQSYSEIIYVLIGGWALFALYYIYKLWKANSLQKINLYIYDSIPTVFTTLGVLGTFVGIFFGLQDFDVNKITESIPTLLDGLKTAFLTSIYGIVLSLIFGKISQIIMRKVEYTAPPEPTDELNALSEITAILRETMTTIDKNFLLLHRALIGDTADSISTQLVKFRNLFAESQKHQTLQLQVLTGIQNTLGGDDETSLLVQIQKLRAEQSDTAEEARKNVNLINTQIDEFSKLSVQNSKEQTQLLTDIQNALGGDDETSLLVQIQKLRAEQNGASEETKNGVERIIQSMYNNNQLISEKFDEFSELLAKSNTEALVNVMKEATELFNIQMSALIERLVQENFQELNNSVQRMNDWQQENKEMITQLTKQFKDVAEDLSITSTSVKEITANTAKLTDENSHLTKLIRELQKVMIEDTKYQEIVKNLTDAINTLKTNTDAFDQTTDKLNKWVKNQMNFNDSVAKLLKRLEEIERIKDINDVFWNNTKTQLNEGVNIIANANRKLSNDLEKIDEMFYVRLNDTLQNLDRLIQQIIVKHTQR